MYANHLYHWSCKSTLDQIHQSLKRFSGYGRFDRLLKRHEISGSIEESHASLDRCMELFSVRSTLLVCKLVVTHFCLKLQATSAIASVALAMEAARRHDKEQVEGILEKLVQNDANILDALDLHHNQTLAAVRSLRNVRLILEARSSCG